MKPILYALWLILLACLCFLACKKETKPLPNTDSKYLSFGNSFGLVVSKMDTILQGGYNNQKFLEIDLNGDQINDLQFSSYIYGSPAIGQHPTSGISCLHPNIKIVGIVKNDTTFRNVTTNIFGASNQFTKILQTTIGCEPLNEKDSILQIASNKFLVQHYFQNDTITLDNFFEPVTASLFGISLNYPPSFVEQIGDTTVLSILKTNYSCLDFPINQEFFIGFLFNLGEVQKLGWVKLSIKDKYIINIKESAMQN